jgi:hypothetical protein
MAAYIVDPSFRALSENLSPQIERLRDQLASGSAADYPAYRQQVGFISALVRVLEICKELDDERHGKKPSETE